MLFNGAPVLFIPGNSGSYKQSRSLASVALRKGIDNDWFQHLDYFAVDLNAEYSALFGGVLDQQTLFIEHCIRAILKLYERVPNPPSQITIVGHSIGGKLAQKLLSSPDTAHLINTVIALASPMDKPVLNYDLHIDSFYKSIDSYWLENRQLHETTNNSCTVRRPRSPYNKKESKMLDDKLLITIGGGNRDLLVHSGLTDSKFSDLHVMTTGIPKVWVEADHLCIVWCHQLVLVVNRFLYSIIAPPKYKGPTSKGLSFINDKAIRLAKAEHHFLGLLTTKGEDKNSKRLESPANADWIEDNRRIFTEKFEAGINRTRVQMIRLTDNILYHSVRVDVINLETYDWIFGCEAIDTTGKSRYCVRGSPIPKHYVERVPSELSNRFHLNLNLHEQKARNPKWTHVILRFSPTREPFQFTVDVHNPSDRQVKVVMPKWYSFTQVQVIDDTLLGASHYQLNVTGLDETHQALKVMMTPKNCAKQGTVAKVGIPWSEGFQRYHLFPDEESLVVWTPKSRPLNYNTTANPVVIDLLLDPSCRYSVAVRQSLGQMLARIVQQFTHWLPAHLVAILCLSIKQQISLTPAGEKFKCGPFHKALASCSPFFIITVTRLFFKFILMAKILPKPETLPTSLTVSILIHGTSLALLTCFTGFVWAAITFCGSMAHKLLLRITRMSFPVISDTFISIIEKFPASVAALLISLAFASCGGIALVLGCIVYFILVSHLMMLLANILINPELPQLSKMYEDYLENFVFKTAKVIALKLFGRIRSSKNYEPDEATPEAEKSEKAEPEPSTSKESPKDKQLVESSDIRQEEKDEDTDRLLDEVMKQQHEDKAKRDKELAAARVEYDGISEGMSEINFHIPLFFLLLLMTVLSAPSVVTWAKNYQHARVLTPDPTLIPAICVLAALGLIWQLPTPRNL